MNKDAKAAEIRELFMKSVLLVVDLEGVAGVDRLKDLFWGQLGYRTACQKLSLEVNAACQGLKARGVGHIIVLDSHASGNEDGNLLPELIQGAEELYCSDGQYPFEFFEKVDAVACLGMHAAAGTTGFAAHTVNIHCRFVSQGRDLSETGIISGLCHQAGIPLLFVSGDQVLQDSLPKEINYLCTKTSSSPSQAQSISGPEAQAGLRRLAEEAKAFHPPPPKDFEVSFKRAWQNALSPPRSFRAGPKWSQQMDAATEYLEGSSELLFESFAAPILSQAFVEDAVEHLRAPFWEGQPDLKVSTEIVWKGFINICDERAGEGAVLKALILWMAQYHAPWAFEERGGQPILQQSLATLDSLSKEWLLPDPDQAMTRLDALWLLRQEGKETPLNYSQGQIVAYLDRLSEEQALIYPWLLAHLAASIWPQLGLDSYAERLLGGSEVMEHRSAERLYILTHKVLLKTNYLKDPWKQLEEPALTERLLLDAAWVAETEQWDLAAELCFCFQAAGERKSGAYAQLLEGLHSQIRQGLLWDNSGADAEEMLDHATGVLLLVLLREEEAQRNSNKS